MPSKSRMFHGFVSLQECRWWDNYGSFAADVALIFEINQPWKAQPIVFSIPFGLYTEEWWSACSPPRKKAYQCDTTLYHHTPKASICTVSICRIRRWYVIAFLWSKIDSLLNFSLTVIFHLWTPRFSDSIQVTSFPINNRVSTRMCFVVFLSNHQGHRWRRTSHSLPQIFQEPIFRFLYQIHTSIHSFGQKTNSLGKFDEIRGCSIHSVSMTFCFSGKTRHYPPVNQTRIWTSTHKLRVILWQITVTVINNSLPMHVVDAYKPF